MLERINPKQGFQNTSNVSATLIECKKKKSPLRNVKACTAFITTSFKLKDCGEDGEPQGRARARGGSEMTERCEALETHREHCPKEPQWERPHAWCEPGMPGPPSTRALCAEPEMGPNKSQRETAESHKAQRLSGFTHVLKEGEVRKKTTLLGAGISQRINLSS